MENEFIPYEQAIALKELGFDEPCFGYWNIDPYLPKPTFNLVKPFEHEWCLPAPLYQQSFKFFREKYNLFGCIDLQISTPTHWYIRIDDIIKNDYIYHSEDDNLEFKTYEEAEFECLIKLIEIAKRNKEEDIM